MAWRETGIMDERMRFVAACLEGGDTMSAICAAFGISRKTGYKWLGRYRSLGPGGLADLPRTPLEHGRATPGDLVVRIVAEKQAHPGWGPKKVAARLRRLSPELAWPAASTVGEILKRHGLVGRRRFRWRATGTGPFAPVREPNDVWSADYKGWFRTRDRKRCEPLTVLDAASRHCLALEACATTGDAEAWPVFERLFHEHGLPRRLRSDNGPPFASAGVTGLTPLSIRFLRLGIELERIDPGKPQQNGAHERYHANLLALAAEPAPDRGAQQQAFDDFRREYNEVRPHEALNFDTPAERYGPSRRKMPVKTPAPEYPPEAAVRNVRSNGEIRWSGGMVYVSASLAGEAVALEEAADGTWALRFYNQPLGVIDQKTMRLVRPAKAAKAQETAQ